jgi:UDP-N-acetylglucosamine transferase subunit ALG13
MILFTVGTNEQRFDRLVRAAAELQTDELLFVQYGASRVPHGPGEWVDFLPFEELAARAREARLVVCHAGVGSIMMARQCGQRPIVVPRRRHLREAVDDHQLVLGRRLERAGVVTLVEDESSLAAVAAAQPRGAEPEQSDGLTGASELSADVRVFLATLGAAEFSGRAA